MDVSALKYLSTIFIVTVDTVLDEFISVVAITSGFIKSTNNVPGVFAVTAASDNVTLSASVKLTLPLHS